MSDTRDRLAGRVARSTSTPQNASTSPPAAPASARTTLSTMSALMIRPRVAPMAVRTPISRPLVAARASRRLARFAQATRKTTVTAPSSIIIHDCAEAVTMDSFIGRTAMPRSANHFGCSSASASLICCIRADAWASSTPPFSRPTTRSE